MARVKKYEEEGFAIKRMMRLRSVSPKDIAKRFNFHPRTLYNYLRGVSRFPPELHQPLAEYLDCTLEELFPPASIISLTATLPQQRLAIVPYSQSVLPPSTHVIQWGGQQPVMPYEVPGFSIFQPGTISNVVAWLGERIVLMQSLARGWQTAASYDQLHALVQAELESWNLLPMTEELKITRRAALSTLAAMSPPLLKQVATGSLAASVISEFFAQASISLEACWKLLHSDGFDIVAPRLSTYLPLLEAVAQRPSPYQRIAARLAAQGNRIAALLALHKNQMPQCDAFHRKGVVFAELSQDANVHVFALRYLAMTLLDYEAEETGRKTSNEALLTLQQALPIVNNPRSRINPKLQGLIWLGYGAGQMHLTHTADRDALAAIDRAKSLFADFPTQAVPYTDPADFMLYKWEGLSYMAVGDLEAAKRAFANLDTLDSSRIAERVRLQIVNHRARLALKMGDLDTFEKFFIEGFEGAQAIGSEKRKQEAIANWQAARKAYPREWRVLQLADRVV